MICAVTICALSNPHLVTSRSVELTMFLCALFLFLCTLIASIVVAIVEDAISEYCLVHKSKHKIILKQEHTHRQVQYVTLNTSTGIDIPLSVSITLILVGVMIVPIAFIMYSKLSNSYNKYRSLLLTSRFHCITRGSRIVK